MVKRLHRDVLEAPKAQGSIGSHTNLNSPTSTVKAVLDVSPFETESTMWTILNT